MNTRLVLRYVHILGGAALGTFVYSPWGALPSVRLAVQAIVFPLLLTATGLAMWQQGKLQRLLRRAGRSGR